MKNKLAKIRPYYKYELTELYEISIKTLMKRIILVEDDLKEYGYSKTQKIFSLKQTEIIFEQLGHPLANKTSGVYKKKRLPIVMYSKKQLAEFYNISDKTFLAQIEALPYEDIKNEIMDERNGLYFKRQVDKTKFTRKEVILIFEWLGHPSKN